VQCSQFDGRLYLCNYLTIKFDDLFISKILLFNYDLVIMLDFHMILHVKSHAMCKL
jgi:hypothetical protein